MGPETLSKRRERTAVFRCRFALAAVLMLAPPACGGTKTTRPETPPDTSGWRQASGYGGAAVWFSVTFTIGSKAYVGTGYGPTTEFWQFDPDSAAWRRKADFPGEPRGAAVAFAIGERGYVATGYTPNGERRFADLWEYDPAGDRWTQKASLPGAGRDHAAAFAVNQRAYVVGGMTCSGADCWSLKEVWAYDPSVDQWTRKADLPIEMTGAASFVLNGMGYLAGGSLGSLAASPGSTALWAYSPQSDIWMREEDLPALPRYRAAGFALNGRGYVATGLYSADGTSATALDDVWEYDPGVDMWVQQSAFAGPARGAAVAFVLGARVYLGTGGTPSGSAFQSLRDFWSWTP